MCQHMRLRSTFGVFPEEGKHFPAKEPVVSTVVNVPSLMQVSAECPNQCVGILSLSVKGFLGALNDIYLEFMFLK